MSIVFVGIMLACLLTGGRLSPIRADEPPPASQSKNQADAPGSHVYIDLAKKVVPSVVNISSLTTLKSPYALGTPDDLFRKFFEEFFGGGGGPAPFDEAPPHSAPRGRRRRPLPKAVALGSGFIIDSAGIILTNNHVVADADEIKINFTELPGETPADGEVIGRDRELDVALIRVKGQKPKSLVPIALGDSDQVEIGELVMAIGNPFGQGHTVTHGIISQKGRVTPDFPLATYLQTDAPINPGNSGGPLINLKGEVVAINNAIEARAQGIGFAIPINVVKEVLPQLKTKGTVSRGYIGVLIGELTPEIAEKLNAPKDTRAPFATQIFEGGPAEKAGIKPYDLIIEFNGKNIQSGSDLLGAVTATQEGKSVPITVLRNGAEKKLMIQIGKRPGVEDLRPTRPDPRRKSREKEMPHLDVGMSLVSLTPELAAKLRLPRDATGVYVSSVEGGGPADQAGLLRGDIVLDVDQKPVKTVEEFYSIIKEKKKYLLRVRRPMGLQQGDAFLVLVLDLSEI